MSYDKNISRREFFEKSAQVGLGLIALTRELVRKTARSGLGLVVSTLAQEGDSSGTETQEPENVLPKIKELNNEFKKAEENYQSKYGGVDVTPDSTYNEQGELEREEFSLEGEIYRINKYVNGNLKTETLYFNGGFHMISEFNIYSRNLKEREYFIEGKFFRRDTFKGRKVDVEVYDTNGDGKFDPNIEPSVYREGSRKSTKK